MRVLLGINIRLRFARTISRRRDGNLSVFEEEEEEKKNRG